MTNSFIYSIDRTSRSWSEWTSEQWQWRRYPHIPYSSKAGASAPDGLVSYAGHSIAGMFYPSAEMQSVYSPGLTEFKALGKIVSKLFENIFFLNFCRTFMFVYFKRFYFGKLYQRFEGIFYIVKCNLLRFRGSNPMSSNLNAYYYSSFYFGVMKWVKCIWQFLLVCLRLTLKSNLMLSFIYKMSKKGK